MALHDATDPQIAALRTLLQGAVNADTAATVTEDAAVSTWGYAAFGDRLPMRVPQGGLPGLAIYRVTDVEAEATLYHTATDAIIGVDYLTSATPVTLIDERTPVLRLVWQAILGAIRNGKHPSVSGGADVLGPAGFTEFVVDSRYPRVDYGTLSSDDAAHLAFRARIRMVHRDAVDNSALDDASLHTEVAPPDLPDDEKLDADDTYVAGTTRTFSSEIHD